MCPDEKIAENARRIMKAPKRWFFQKLLFSFNGVLERRILRTKFSYS